MRGSIDDTIAAISTPLGQGGIGIVRLSGPQALDIARLLLRTHDGEQPIGALRSHRLYYGHIVHPCSGKIIDEVLLSAMRAPRTYTRQDVVEINAHGGIVPLREILSLCLEAGARPASEGEFTLRAYLNGRLDLAQAEAVLDIIQARTEASLRVALDQLGGRLSGQVRAIRRGLMQVLAHLEASIDFPDDEIPPLDVQPALEQAAERLVHLNREAQRGIVYRQGVHTVIVGRPNVGKSSLLNTLLRTERAIVTPIPGTTRDTLEETVDLQGVPLVLVDTAGINATEDVIERLGIERSRRSIARADLVLLTVDGSVAPQAEDLTVAALVQDKVSVVVLNKSDLGSAHQYGALLPGAPHVPVSALTGQGIPDLEETILRVILSGAITLGDDPVASNPRHRDIFRRALEHVREAMQADQAGMPADLVSIDVREAVDALGQVTGETASEDLLSTIFGEFCIGK